MIAVVSALFPILSGGVLTLATCLALGELTLRALKIRVYRQERWPLAFVAGGAALSAVVFALGMLKLIYPAALVFISILSIALGCIWRKETAPPRELPPLPTYCKLLFGAGFLAYNLLYIRYALAPETSPDGMMYHLGLVNLYSDAHGVIRLTTNMYASLSQGMEMLFLFAFTFGRHSAATLVHYCFFVCLPLLMLLYARRFAMPAAGVFGSLTVFATPVLGIDGTSAYVDAGLACIVFAAFYVLQIWDEERQSGILILAGILSGFAFAIKYTGGCVLAGALGFVLWRSIRSREGKAVRDGLILCAGAAPLILAWLMKNWIWMGNPIAPFGNAIFPNPYVHVSFEREYTYGLRHWNGVKLWEVPVEVTVLGARLGGLIGPLFLAAPIALLAARHRQGRRLLAAVALTGMVYVLNLGARFIIPMLPFLSLAMGIALSRFPVVLVALVFAHLISCWPTVLNRYCEPRAWRLPHIPWTDVLRIESEDAYLRKWNPDYSRARLIESAVPPGARVFTFTGVAQSYTSHEILVSFQAAFNQRLQHILCAGFLPADCQPLLTRRFSFRRVNVRALRVIQRGRGTADFWSIGEVHLGAGSVPLPWHPEWRVEASPNPWDAALAVDGSPVTRWSSWEIIRPGMFFEIDLRRNYPVDTVRLDLPGAQWENRLELEASEDGRRWFELSDASVLEKAPPIPDYRRLAALEVKRLGVAYLLVKESDYEWKDFAEHCAEWGVTPIGSVARATLYRID